MGHWIVQDGIGLEVQMSSRVFGIYIGSINL